MTREQSADYQVRPSRLTGPREPAKIRAGGENAKTSFGKSPIRFIPCDLFTLSCLRAGSYPCSYNRSTITTHCGTNGYYTA